MSFKDHFSLQSGGYRQFRPDYPDALFRHLAAIAPGTDLAWDCATGSGQSARVLKDYFSRVIATDASESQIAQAQITAGIAYRVAPAENSGIPSGSIDLITVAQALHWFDIDRFAAEAVRVLKPGGVLAAWSYNLLQVSPAVDRIVNQLYGSVLEGYWPPERQRVEAGYGDIRLPLSALDAPAIEMTHWWSLRQLVGYLSTWSAVVRYQQERGEDPVTACYEEFAAAWGEPDKTRQVCWPLSLRLWRKDSLG